MNGIYSNNPEVTFNTVFQACENSDWDELEKIHHLVAGVVNEKGLSIFFNYIATGNIHKVRAIASKEKLRAALSNNQSHLSLHFAIKNGRPNLVTICLSFGCGTPSTKNAQGRIPLHYAIKDSSHHLIHQLSPHNLMKAPPASYAVTSKKLNVSLCLLAYAVKHGSVAGIDYLITVAGYSLPLTQVKGVGNLLHFSIHQDRSAIVIHIFSCHRTDALMLMNQHNEDGLTPLMLASSKNDLISLKVLILNNADLEMQDLQGRTALFYTALHGHEEAAKMLIKYGANLECKDNQKKMPRDYVPAEKSGMIGLFKKKS